MKQYETYCLKINPTILYFVVTLLLMVVQACTSTNEKLVIATAANAQFAMQEIANAFTEETGIATELVISSSGKHTAQILAGAPYDVFASADMKYPEKIYANDLSTRAPKIYAFGQLVIWALDSANLPAIDRLKTFNGDYIALPNPETAPYGFAAREALEKLQLWSALQERLVFGESVAQANQYIISGAAAAGFTASSIVTAPVNLNIGTWTAVADSLYSPIAQGVVVMRNSQHLLEAEKFCEYLFSARSQEILESYGYRTPVEQ